MEPNGFLTTIHDDIRPANCILTVCMHSSLSFIKHAPTASNLNINVHLNLYVHVCRFVCFYMCLSVAVCSPLYPCRSTLIVEYKVFWIKRGKKNAEPSGLPAGISLNCNDKKDTVLKSILNQWGQLLGLLYYVLP